MTSLIVQWNSTRKPLASQKRPCPSRRHSLSSFQSTILQQVAFVHQSPYFYSWVMCVLLIIWWNFTLLYFRLKDCLPKEYVKSKGIDKKIKEVSGCTLIPCFVIICNNSGMNCWQFIMSYPAKLLLLIS